MTYKPEWYVTDTRTKCYSAETIIKHEHLKLFYRKHLAIVRNIAHKNKATYKYLYIDLNSGMGIDPSGDKCSPLIFWDESRINTGLDIRCLFVEKRKVDFYNLVNECMYYDSDMVIDCEFKRMDNLKFSCEFCDGQYGNIFSRYDYGLIFADPEGGGKREFKCLEIFAYVFKKVDMLIYLQGANMKRFNHNDELGENHNHLSVKARVEQMRKFRKYSFIREPHGDLRFSLLLFTNLNNIWGYDGDLRMYRTDSKIGKEIINDLTYTKGKT